MGSIKAGGKSGAIFGDDDYLPLEKLSVDVKGAKEEKVSFTLCFWIYVLKSSKPGILIRQSREGSELSVPFLTFDTDRKVNLCPLPPSACAQLPEAGITDIVTSDKPFPLEKWVHFGCEVATDVARLHMDGVVVGEKALTSPLQDENEVLRLHLYGGDGPAYANSVQAYAHYVRLLPQPTVTNHYVKNPPLELMLDGSSGASDDNEVEEGGDGVWSVVGGKASCRRNFALDVALLDALGRSIHKDMELVALLVYADSGSPVEKPKDDSEAPLLTTFDGVEFPSTERPIKLVHGRASFKLKISQLSSKCDNRLFRVCFDSLNTPKYPFLRTFSRPIRCVSRNRNHRHPTVTWKRQSPAIAPAESVLSPSTEEPQLSDFSKLKNDFHSNGAVAGPTMNGNSVLPPLKRLCTAADKGAPPTPNGLSSMERPCEPVGGGLPSPVTIEMQLPVIRGGHSMAAQINAGYNWLGGMSPDPRPKEAIDSFGHSLKQDGVITDGVHGLNGAGLEIPRMQKTFGLATGASDGAFSDYLVFHYCLLSMYGRVQFLRKTLMSKTEHQINDFASRVSEYTGCRHNGYQIRIARQLLHEGGEIWKKASRDFHPVLWVNLITHVEESFLKISGCNTRRFTEKDKEFVRRIAGCGEFVSPDEFDRLWHWIFPVSFALSSPQLRALWEMQDPRWIEGMISREEGESLLKTSHGVPKPGVFLLRFANSRIWPHPDAGALVVSYVGADMRLNHKLLSLDENLGSALGDRLDSAKPLSDLLLSQPELSELCRAQDRRKLRGWSLPDMILNARSNNEQLFGDVKPVTAPYEDLRPSYL